MDLLLDENSHDIVFVNGQTPVTQGQVQIVAQRLKIKLWTFLGEWFLNLDVGVPYRQRILTKVAHKATVDIIFQRLLAEDEGEGNPGIPKRIQRARSALHLRIQSADLLQRRSSRASAAGGINGWID